MPQTGRREASIAPDTSPSARPVTPPPHGFSRGWVPSTSVTRAPRRASPYAAQHPAGPAPTMTTSATSQALAVIVIHYRHGRDRCRVVHGGGVSGPRVGPEGRRRADSGWVSSRVADHP